MPAILSIALEQNPAEAYAIDPNNFYVTQYWRLIWTFPAVLAVIQTVLLTTYFNFDTPVEMQAKEQTAR